MPSEVYTVIVAAITGAVSGGIVNYLIEKQKQRHTTQKELNEKIYHPLLDELNSILPEINKYSTEYNTSAWMKIKANATHYNIPQILREEITTFIEADLHNFTIYCINAKQQIDDFIEKDLEKRIKNYKHPSGVLFIYKELPIAEFVLRKSKEGGYRGEGYLGQYGNQFNEQKKYYNLKEFETLEEYINYIYENTKNQPWLKDKEEKREKIYGQGNSLIKKIEKIANVNK